MAKERANNLHVLSREARSQASFLGHKKRTRKATGVSRGERISKQWVWTWRRGTVWHFIFLSQLDTTDRDSEKLLLVRNFFFFLPFYHFYHLPTKSCLPESPLLTLISIRDSTCFFKGIVYLPENPSVLSLLGGAQVGTVGRRLGGVYKVINSADFGSWSCQCNWDSRLVERERREIGRSCNTDCHFRCLLLHYSFPINDLTGEDCAGAPPTTGAVSGLCTPIPQPLRILGWWL